MQNALGRYAALALFMPGAAAIAAPAPDPAMSSKPASAATIAAQKKAEAALPAEDGRDADFARRGFIASRTDPVIADAKGKPVWKLGTYGFVEGAAPATVHPSLWRQMTLMKEHGLYQVAEGVWQVRGFDLSNMTVVRGDTGWIVIDPLTTRETAAAAMELVNQQLGSRPVSAVIYSHSHADHFGGVRGVIDEIDATNRKVAIVAPEHFTQEAASENVMAGAAMTRRASYQFGAGLAPGARGQMGSGIGQAVPAGEVTLIAPTDTIARTSESRTIDGVRMEFQIVSGSEAPSELNVYIAPQKVFLSAEMSTCTLHNILTPRGAKVRDTHAWAGYLDEALRLYGHRSDVILSSHCWPRYGQDEVSKVLASQRDNYRYLHDQTVRLMNQGETQTEIAEALVQPPALADQWYNHGYYGTFSHNSKAIYQYYLGWYDANPANLNPWPPAERAKRTVAAMGGGKKVIALARKAMDEGDYRWSSDLLDQLVFAEPGNAKARSLLADSFEQQGYQSESGIWRNQFLSAAHDLRNAAGAGTSSSQGADMIAAVPTQLLLDSVATRFDPAKLGGRTMAINLFMPERKEGAGIELTGTTMFTRMEPLGKADVTISAPRRLLLGLLFLKLPLGQLELAGLTVEGNRDAAQAWLDALAPASAGFNIVEP